MRPGGRARASAHVSQSCSHVHMRTSTGMRAQSRIRRCIRDGTPSTRVHTCIHMPMYMSPPMSPPIFYTMHMSNTSTHVSVEVCACLAGLAQRPRGASTEAAALHTGQCSDLCADLLRDIRAGCAEPRAWMWRPDVRLVRVFEGHVAGAPFPKLSWYPVSVHGATQATV